MENYRADLINDQQSHLQHYGVLVSPKGEKRYKKLNKKTTKAESQMRLSKSKYSMNPTPGRLDSFRTSSKKYASAKLDRDAFKDAFDKKNPAHKDAAIREKVNSAHTYKSNMTHLGPIGKTLYSSIKANRHADYLDYMSKVTLDQYADLSSAIALQNQIEGGAQQLGRRRGTYIDRYVS